MTGFSSAARGLSSGGVRILGCMRFTRCGLWALERGLSSFGIQA